ncbi:MAG: outer membrane porin, OprD family, partial [Pseudomonas sp.]|nr:outer membrane porin, OprD family [Pseudomonas sp.]
MRLFNSSALALAIGAATTTVHADPQSQAYLPLTLAAESAQAQAKGFVDGQSLGGTTRNWYARERATRAPLWRYYKSDGTRHPTHTRENWVQGT